MPVYTSILTHSHTYTYPRYTNIHTCTLTLTPAARPRQLLASQLRTSLPAPPPRTCPSQSPGPSCHPSQRPSFPELGHLAAPQEKPPGGRLMFIKWVPALHRTILACSCRSFRVSCTRMPARASAGQWKPHSIVMGTSHKCQQAEPACLGEDPGPLSKAHRDSSPSPAPQRTLPSSLRLPNTQGLKATSGGSGEGTT